MMLRRLICGFLFTAFAHAAHFDVRLTATTASGAKSQAGMDETPPIGGFNKRPVLKVKPGEEIRIDFLMTNVYTHDAFIDSGVRYYIVKQGALGQKAVPPIEGAPVQGSFNFALKPQAKIAVRTRVTITEPGVYLLRVESFNTQRDHEHFGAIDLDIR